MNTTKPSKPTLRADLKTCTVLSAYMASHDLKDLCVFDAIEDNSRSISLAGQLYTKPVRLGEVLDAIKMLYSQNNSPLIFNDGVLDIEQALFTENATSKASRLTEKEVAILCFLHEHKGMLVSRKDLLSAVWEYAENVETHTLETHIYRLRQKIEHDPSHPQILLTQENGYLVK